MASESCASIIDWLSEVEASGNTQDSSLSTATSSPSSAPSAFSSPCLTGSLHPRKRKLDSDHYQPFTESLYLVKYTRKALREIMPPNGNKRPRRDTASENDVQGVDFERGSTHTPQKGEPSSSSQFNLQTPEPSRPSTSSRSDAKTPSSTRKKIPPALAANAHNIRNTLERHGMWYDDEEAFDRCPNLKEMVTEIITDAPRSQMADTSAKKVLAAVKKNYTQNEKTVFRKVQPLIVKLARKVAKQENSEVSGGIEIIKREFEEDDLQVIEDCNFTKRLLPLPDSVTNDKDMGLTEPKPDFTYGIAEPKRIPDAEVHVPKQLLAYLGVAPHMRYPFYVEEYKSAEEGIVKAEHQAMRDGAVLVNARMKLNQKLKPAGWVSPVGADIDSFIFSCAWTPDIAKIFVNWYEKLPDGKEIFHMTKLGSSYRMDHKDDIKQMRHDVHNILDWGLLKFRWRAQQVWEEIVAHYLQMNSSQG